MIHRHDDALVDFIVTAITTIPLHFELVDEMEQTIRDTMCKFEVYELTFTERQKPLFTYKHLKDENAPFFVGTHWTEGLCPYHQARVVTDEILWIYNSYAMKRFDRHWGTP